MNLSEMSILVLVLFLVISFFIWAEGYKLYRFAIFFLGFLTGFTLTGVVLEYITALPWPGLITQIAAGLILGALSFFIVKLGLFIAAACAVFTIVNPLLKPLGTIGMVIAFASAVVAGFVATKADEPVIIVLTAALGGFVMPMVILEILNRTPYDTSFLPETDTLIWLIVKIVLSVVGAAIQFMNYRKGKE